MTFALAFVIAITAGAVVGMGAALIGERFVRGLEARDQRRQVNE